jgi:RHS repeat-associated protein
VVKATDEDRNIVWDAVRKPFGRRYVTVEQVEMPLGFPGQYYDRESGNFYNYYRDYDPATGRYLQSDPIGLRGGLNTYVYVNDNPLVWIDPLGFNRWLIQYPTLLEGGGPSGSFSRVTKLQGPKFPNLKDHAQRHSTFDANRYYNQAIKNIETGKRFNYRHDGQQKICYITRIGPNKYTFTSTNKSGNVIFTHLIGVNTNYLGNLGITLPLFDL